MKKHFFGVIALIAAVALNTVVPCTAIAEETPSAQEKAVEIFDDLNGKANDVTEAVYDAVADAATDEQALSILMNGLEKVGIKGGWAKKLGELNKIKGVSKAFSKAVKALNAGKTIGELSAAYQNGDKDTFHNIVADQLTDLAAGLVGKAVGAAIHAAGGAIIGAAALTGPGFLIASGVVLVADWVISGWVEDKIAEAIKDGTMYEAFQKVGDLIWDMIHRDEKNKEPDKNPETDGGPLDGLPDENGTDDSNGGGFQGLKPIKLL